MTAHDLMIGGGGYGAPQPGGGYGGGGYGQGRRTLPNHMAYCLLDLIIKVMVVGMVASIEPLSPRS